MPLFQYKALDAESRFVTGEIEAANSGEAMALLDERGLVVLETTQRRTSHTKKGFSTRRLSSRDVTTFLSECALVLRSGVPLTEALSLLEQGLPRRLGAIVCRVRVDILSGSSLMQALQRHPEAFPDDLVAMVRVAEAGGCLDAVLEEIATQRARAESLLDKINSSIRYPLFLFSISICVLFFFLLFIVPQFSNVINDIGGNPGDFIKTILFLSNALTTYGNQMLIALVILSYLMYSLLRQAKIRQLIFNKFISLPLIRDIAMLHRCALFCRSLSTLLSQGVTLTDSLRVIANLFDSGNGKLEEILMTVRRGSRLSDALSESNFLPSVAVRMLRVGEQTGELAGVAKRAAQLYEIKLVNQLDRMTAIFGPAAIIFVSAIIGSLIVSIMSALLSVNQMVI